MDLSSKKKLISNVKIETHSSGLLSLKEAKTNSIENSIKLSIDLSMDNLEENSLPFEKYNTDLLDEIELKIIKFLEENSIEMCSPTLKKEEHFQRSKTNLVLLNKGSSPTQSLNFDKSGLLSRRKSSLQTPPNIQKSESENIFNFSPVINLKAKMMKSKFCTNDEGDFEV